MIDKKELERRLRQTLGAKIFHFVSVFVEYFIFYHGEVYLAWSGGKDSDVGCDIVDRIWSGEFVGKYMTKDTWQLVTSYPKPPRVFCNTGLEFPEIVERVRERKELRGDVVILKPKMGFIKVIKEIGVAVGSKKIAEMIYRLRKYIANPSPKNEATRNLYLNGVRKDGSISKSSKLPNRWKPLLNAPFPVAHKCCDVFKKEPFRRYIAETGKKAVAFTTTEESARRTIGYMQTGCNTFEKGKEMCRPYSIFTEKDTWEYAERFSLTFAPVYYERTVDVEQLDGSFITRTLEAETRTGCTFCMFGVHLESKKKNNRIQRLALSHPKYYDVIINKGGLGFILEYCGIPYKPMISCKQNVLFDEI